MAAAEHEVTRLEAFSDAVFGFAITLLVVSLEVPNTFDELMQVIAACRSSRCASRSCC